jgi:hypothetical protein
MEAMVDGQMKDDISKFDDGKNRIHANNLCTIEMMDSY